MNIGEPLREVEVEPVCVPVFVPEPVDADTEEVESTAEVLS